MSSQFEKIKKCFKSISSLKFIMFLRLIFGNYYNVSSSKIISFFVKLYCISITSIVSIITIPRVPFRSAYLFPCVKFIFNVILCLLTADEYFFKYCKSLKTFDAIMGIKKSSLISKDVIFITMFVFISRSIEAIHFGVFTANIISILSVFLSITFTLLSIDTYNSTVMIVFGVLNNRMKRLREHLEGNTIPVNIVGNDQIEAKIKQLRKGVRYYNNLLDNMDNAHQQVQFLWSITLVLAFPQLIMHVYSALNGFVVTVNTKYAMLNFVEICHIIISVSSPAVIAEMIISEVDLVKTTLLKQQFKCSDESLRFELEIALEYVTCRPFSFTMWRAIPLDSSLPIGILGLSITYVIVIMQLINFTF